MKTSLMLAVAAAAALSFSAHALPVIDAFDASTQTANLVDTTANDSGLWTVNPVSAPSIIGGFRDIFVTKTGLLPNDTGEDVQARIANNGRFSFSSSNGSTGQSIIRWDGATNITPTGLVAAKGAIDPIGLQVAGVGKDLLAFGNTVQLVVTSADLGFNFAIEVYTSATQFSKLSLISGGPGTYDIPFSFFTLGGPNPPVLSLVTGGGGVDFSNVGAIQAFINTSDVVAVDMSIDIVRVIPEPGSLALVGASLLCLAAARRRKTAQA